jgi:uncharacterized membrane protein
MEIWKIGVISGYFLLADFVWITQFATVQYQARLGDMLQMAEGWQLGLGLVAVYVLLLLGLFYFVLTSEISLVKAVVFGLVVYGVYGFTNYLILDKWSLDLVLIDFVWGGFLYGSSAAIARLIHYTQ